jgi:hypothetical protein
MRYDMKRSAKVPGLSLHTRPKVGVVEKKRLKDQRNLTTSTLVVCLLGSGLLGYINNEQYGIPTQDGVYVSTDYQVLLKYISLF